MATSASAQRGHAVQESTTFFGVFLGWFIKLLGVAIVAMLISILIEWVGMYFNWWSEGGLAHSENMVRQELSYLSFISDEQGAIVSVAIQTMIGTIQSGLFSINDFSGVGTLVSVSEVAQVGVSSAINIIYVFFLRMIVLFLSIPTFILFGAAGLLRGLVARDKRKWGGGRESSGMFHLYLKLLPVAFISLWVGYLSMPWSVNPFFLVGPTAVIFAFLVSGLAYRMKKYI